MQRFYANKDHLTNLEIIPIVKFCIQTMTALGEQPLQKHSRVTVSNLIIISLILTELYYYNE